MKYTAQSLATLQADTPFLQPPELPKVVHIDDPASDVMTDFKHVHPVTITPDTPIDDALETMKTAGVRLLLVVDEKDSIVGIITSNDIEGERPIEIVHDERVPRAEISVKRIMMPQSEIQVLELNKVQNLQIGHIAETLRQLDKQHLLVVHQDVFSNRQIVCGLFSMTQIKRLLRSSDRIADPEHEPTVSGLVHGEAAYSHL